MTDVALRPNAVRKRLMLTGYLLGVTGAVLFAATWFGYRGLMGSGADPSVIAVIASEAAELTDADADLPRELRGLAEQARAVASGDNPFAAPPVESLKPIKGPDGKLIQPGDPRYDLVAGRDAAEADEAGDPESEDLSEMPPSAALARESMSMAGRLQSYAGWLRDAADESEARLGGGAAAGDAAEESAADHTQADDGVIRERIADYRQRSHDLARVAAELEAAAIPLADPVAWQRELTLHATLFALLAAALPLGGGAVCYHLARVRGRLPRIPSRVPAAAARAWRQDRDLQYNGFSAYLAHVMLIGLSFVGLSHCAYDLGPPGGGGGEVGEENPVEQVQVVEVKRRKLIVNPFSPISLEKPDELEIEIEELTERLATAAKAGGEGAGEGGYEGGAGNAFTFVAINHGGAHWDEATKSSAAAKFLNYFGSRTGVRTKRRPLELSVGNLMAQDDPDQQPAMIYFTVSSSAPRFSRKEFSFLRSYVEDIGGVILIDAVGRGAKRHADAIARGITGASSWRVIGRDDALMSSREDLTAYSDRELALSAHDGANLLGIRASDGYWGIIYHPGDLVDAWRGAYDAAWQDTGFKIGTNVADYAMKRFTRRRRSPK